MWKIALAFIVFAALALYVLNKGGDSLSMAGEQHGGDVAGHAASAPASAASR